MKTNTTNYQFSHGCNPRGEGYWGLVLTGTDDEGRYTKETYWENGTFTEAKKSAISRMKREIAGVKRVVEIEVLP